MELTALEIAGLSGGTVEGDPQVRVSSFAKIEEACLGDLTFLANPKYTHYLYDTHASAVLVSDKFQPEHPLGVTLIRVKDPYAALAHLMTVAQNATRPRKSGMEQPSYIGDEVEMGKDNYVGAFAYVGSKSKIGDRTLIYPQVYIGDGVEIGEDCIIYAGAKIYSGCKIGNRCIVHSGAVIGSDGFGFAPVQNGFEKIPQIGNVVLEDDTEIGANTTIDRATMGSTRIGSGTKLDNLIQVAHNVTIGSNNVFAAQSGIAGSTHIGNGNMVGGQVGFAGHIKVGDNNEIGAQTGIPNNVGSDRRIIGCPAVDARTFARNTVYISRLADLFKRVDSLEKNNKQIE